MKTIIICDSGIGGLEVADRLIRSGTSEAIKIIYFNAFPDESFGYNSMKLFSDRVRMFDSALQGMMKFSPAEIVIACNTLSIIYRDTQFAADPPCKVTGIVDSAIVQISDYLQLHPDKKLVILGTSTTIESHVYQNALQKKGFKIYGYSCPGLAKEIETDPNSQKVIQMVQNIYKQTSTVDALALCCTHYGFITPLWQRIYGKKTVLINPNVELANLIKPGTTQSELEIYSRVRFLSDKLTAISPLFSAKTITALNSYVYDPKLFAIPDFEGVMDKF